MDYRDDELKQIVKTAYKWDLYAVFSPVIFLIIIGVSIYIGLIATDMAFYIGLFMFAITTIVWWVWTIFTIKKLAITLTKVGSNLLWVKTEFKKIRDEISKLNNNK